MNTTHRRKLSYKIYLTITLTLLFVLVLLGAAYAYYYSNDWAYVHYLTPDDEIVAKVRIGREHTILDGVEQEGYTFLRWRDEQGNAEKRETITVYEDVWYAADYAIALMTDEHPVYLFPDEDGFYRPHDLMLRSDAVTMLHILLGKPAGSGSFLDVAAKAPYAKAAAALQELGQSYVISMRSGKDFIKPRRDCCKIILERHLADILGIEPGQLVHIKDAGRIVQTVDVKCFNQLIHSKELSFITGIPSDQCQVIDQRFLQITFFNEITVICITVAIGKLVLAVTHNGRQMHILGNLPAKCIIKSVVLR